MGKCSHTCSPKKKNPPKYYCKSEGLKFIRAHEGTRTPTTVGHCHLKTARLPITPHALDGTKLIHFFYLKQKYVKIITIFIHNNI